jgi:hypothetical protein
MFSLLLFTLTIIASTADTIETVTPLTIAPDYLALAAVTDGGAQESKSSEQITTDNQITNNQITEQQKSIVITNGIEPQMLAYKHWTGTYNPELFTIQVNGTEVAAGSTYSLESAATPLQIRYDYSFVNGTRKGGKIVSYTLNENSDSATITFSWQDTWKVMVSNATPIKEETV